MHWLQRSTLKSARAWRLKMALRAVYASAAAGNDREHASKELKGWLSWARRSRLEPFRKLAKTLSERFEAVVRGMLDSRSNAYVEAMNGLLQQAKRAARGFRTARNFIAIAYLRRPDGSPRARWALISGLTLCFPPSSPHAGAAPPATGARLRSPL
jgi:transposase